MKLNEWIIKEITEDMERWYGFTLTKSQAHEIMTFCKERCGLDDCGFDTTCREAAADFIGKRVTGMVWPLGQDSENYCRKFFQKLTKKAKSKGYQLDDSRYSQYIPKLKLRFSEDV